MKKIYLKYKDGVYYADIDITVQEWKEMLNNSDIFYKEALNMILNWYREEGHQATSKTMTEKYYPDLNNSPYNGIVNGLSTRILKYINRFEVIGTHGEKTKFIIPFEGWHEDYDTSKNFIWKVRKELAEAILELNLVNDTEKDVPEEDMFTTNTEIETTEGKKVVYYTSRYERSHKNREAAIFYHGTVCQVCGFDFKKVYGELGKNYIEVHHVKPLYSLDEIVEIDPKKDLVCLCANCHRMIHRKKNEIITVDELRNIINKTNTDS